MFNAYTGQIVSARLLAFLQGTAWYCIVGWIVVGLSSPTASTVFPSTYIKKFIASVAEASVVFKRNAWPRNWNKHFPARCLEFEGNGTNSPSLPPSLPRSLSLSLSPLPLCMYIYIYIYIYMGFKFDNQSEGCLVCSLCGSSGSSDRRLPQHSIAQDYAKLVPRRAHKPFEETHKQCDFVKSASGTKPASFIGRGNRVRYYNSATQVLAPIPSGRIQTSHLPDVWYSIPLHPAVSSQRRLQPVRSGADCRVK